MAGFQGASPDAGARVLRDFSGTACDLDGASLFLTGGTGSFGHQFLDTVTRRFRPRRLVIFSRDELKQYETAQRFSPEAFPFLEYVIGDVRDAARVHEAMRGAQIVIHAAAMKHVPVAEANPFECVQTNIHGAEHVVRAAIACGVEKVVALSSDKAAAPVNLYGATKLASDKIFIAANNRRDMSKTRFSVVRYGNVVGSRGSVAPFFQSLASSGARDLPITDPRMTRFWITLDQGVNFVLSVLSDMRGGEIFVPKLPSMRTIDLARAIAPGLPHRIIGARPGEKLHEVMITPDDSRCTLDAGDRYVVVAPGAQDVQRAWEEAGAEPVRDGWSYASDSNPEQLDIPGLQSLLGIARPALRPTAVKAV
ncbi:UDP-N-acetylglucosamine 4,6-dehydratase (inverting) [Alkalicaulis satelles]|uniref:UDP-N-acetylglucosamine 4,6-dehydratase (Inverting) n=1 Tax=Alkalicaulis satelles TaxID=2609175 RepID=A0A5M6ZGG9_9PROT|nr:UDP-N-acetylglucosamine 4,6-dehydratase (inverting) [Alkalicaulis satelles]KAA5803355.1 UDP-N-acetylglucosamine 4,6-dehydratase (inverting) [Alkalicaulis satelles]